MWSLGVMLARAHLGNGPTVQAPGRLILALFKLMLVIVVFYSRLDNTIRRLKHGCAFVRPEGQAPKYDQLMIQATWARLKCSWSFKQVLPVKPPYTSPHRYAGVITSLHHRYWIPGEAAVPDRLLNQCLSWSCTRAYLVLILNLRTIRMTGWTPRDIEDLQTLINSCPVLNARDLTEQTQCLWEKKPKLIPGQWLDLGRSVYVLGRL